MAHGTVAAHRVAGLPAHISLLQPLPTSAFQPPPEAGSAGGVTQGMSFPMLASGVVCPVAELSSSDMKESTHRACSSGCLQKQVLALSPGSWNAEVQSERNKSTASFLSSLSIYSVS